MATTTHRPHARLLAAAVLTALVAVLGLTTPARAADQLSYSGRVALPSGYVYDASAAPRLYPYSRQASGHVQSYLGLPYATVRADGTFTITHTPNAADPQQIVGNHLLLVDPQQRLVRGYLAADGSVVPFHPDAVVLPTTVSDLQIRPAIGAQIAGRLQLPADFTPAGAGNMRLDATIGGSSSDRTAQIQGRVDLAKGTFVAGGFVPGEKVRLQFYDYDHDLFVGYLDVDGQIDPNPGRRAQLTAPQTDLVVPMHRRVQIGGRIEFPEGYQRPGTMLVRAKFNGGGREHDTSWVHADDSFLIEELSAAQEYVLEIDHWSDAVRAGLVGPGGKVIPTGKTTASYAAAWAQATKFRGGSQVTIYPELSLGVRGSYVVPPGFSPASATGRLPEVELETRDPESGARQFVGVKIPRDDAATFDFLGLEEDEEYFLSFDPNVDAGSDRARFSTGYWTGNDTPLTTDPALAKPLRANLLREVVIPLETRATTRPSITGTAVLGKKIWVARGVWDPATATTAVQWLRDGQPISGATASSYTVTKSDLGRKLSVRVAARGPQGYTRSTATTAAVTVPKVTPEVSVWVPSGIKAGQKVQVAVRVTATSVTSAPLGTVRVRVGSSTRTVSLTSSGKGKVTVTMPAQTKGTYDVRAAYTPSSAAAQYLTSKTSTTLRVKIT